MQAGQLLRLQLIEFASGRAGDCGEQTGARATRQLRQSEELSGRAIDARRRFGSRKRAKWSAEERRASTCTLVSLSAPAIVRGWPLPARECPRARPQQWTADRRHLYGRRRRLLCWRPCNAIEAIMLRPSGATCARVTCSSGPLQATLERECKPEDHVAGRGRRLAQSGPARRVALAGNTRSQIASERREQRLPRLRVGGAAQIDSRLL